MRYLVAFTIALCVAAPSVQASTPCDDAVDRQLFEANTWMSLAEWYHEHPHCVDGYMAEHVTSQIATWLAQERPAFLKLQASVSAHPEFEPFVNWELRGEYHSVATLRKIAENADKSCPSEAASVCENIRATVRATLQQSKRSGRG